MAGIIIKPRSRIFQGHDWIYASEVKKTFGEPEPGEVITLKDFKDRPLGAAIYNPQSQIIARRFSHRAQDIDLPFLVRRLERAFQVRQNLPLDERVCRVVWSESDGLPGVILDRFDDVFVLQTTTLAFDQRKDLLVEAIAQVFSPRAIILRNDTPMRTAEGLESESGLLLGEDPGPIEVTLDGLTFELDLANAQKTGLYLDITNAYPAVARFAKGAKVLDMFCNQGGFGLACAQAGAESVTAVDISEKATAAAARNAELNGLTLTTETGNAFDNLRHREKREEKYDLVILDPPSFTRNKKTVNSAMKGYKEIHLRAIRLLNPGGRLATFCCSHHATRELFLDSVRAAANDAKKTLRLVESHGQRADHPILAHLPETEYLKGFTFELMGSF
ncbi:class I SAM-dependent rRNA methyltransferase [Roseibacillus ishigakijimensis]|uniref:Class I SAM-dependent rRNA methyltransferase n=2 Tax=Roseibacillus ishigakijimensis TaxID=454146 RepID=A0A934RQK9_9BACT|nr:class I SAM-dependent rRNA methyltransferase [Roseibacillus ishigakijimensis]MBK1833786.1 class I SAM-dependent rRNA methyltransferase [Roseibacillus ishigakijimensis]